MKLFGRVSKTYPDMSFSDYPYRGVIYNEQGLVVSTGAVGMTEKQCADMVRTLAQGIRNGSFQRQNGIFEV